MRTAFCIFLLFIQTLFHLPAQYSGTIFFDQNANGILDGSESGIKNVMVSDGLEIVKTDDQGRFQLSKRKAARFIYVTTPDGFQCNPFYQRITSEKAEYNFGLSKLPISTENGVRFIQITDTETDKDNTGWIQMLKSYMENEEASFLIHTGDICYEKGMRFHARNLNTRTMNKPVYYCIGNHDLVKGKYGEELYEELFGPGWYSFEMGGSHFIVTPMLRGDFKPGYTKKDIYLWLKNLLSHLDQNQPKFIFNHDLLTGDDEFIYGISEEEEINLNQHNLKAWVYGHWHNSFYRPHGNSGVVSICTGVAQRGGIDHSLSQFRVFNLETNGAFTTELVQSYVDHQLSIVSPSPSMKLKGDRFPVLVNTYNSTSSTREVRYKINEGDSRPLEKQSNWSWAGKHEVDSTINIGDSLNISVTTYFNDGIEKKKERRFILENLSKVRTKKAAWPNFLMNAQHHPGKIKGPSSPLSLDWVTNVGANIYMCSPLVSDGKVFIASYDNGDARNCFVFAYDYYSGEKIWQYRTENSIKGAIAYEEGKVFATDMVGNVYSIHAETGDLVWKRKLGMGPLPGYISGTIAYKGIIYTGEGKGFCALRHDNGEPVWCNENWNAGVGGPPSPVIGKDVVVASSNWNALYAHDLESGELLWKKKDLGLRFRDAAPVFYKDTLFVGTQKSLLAISPRTGEILRKKETEFKLNTNSTPLIFKDLMILGTGSDGIVAFNRKDFSQAWKFKTRPALSTSTPYSEPPQRTAEASPVVVNNSEIFIGASDGLFYCLDAESGQLKWKMEVGAPIFSTVAVTKDRIFLSDIAGNLYSFRGE